MSSTMRVVVLALLFAARAEGLGQEPGQHQGAFFDFKDEAVRHFAVGDYFVYVVTESRLYQFSHNLTLIRSVSQRGVLQSGVAREDARFMRVSEGHYWNATFIVNTLVPFPWTETLITCGVTECSHCELRSLNNISNVVYEENIHVGSLNKSDSSASVGFLVEVEWSGRNETYILTANAKKDSCLSDSETVNLQNTNDRQTGGIFAFKDENRRQAHLDKNPLGEVRFVDGFQVQSVIYLFSNWKKLSGENIRLIYLEGKGGKSLTFKSLRGATLECCDDRTRTRLQASSVIPGAPPVLWAGVFVGNDPKDKLNTALVVFDISPDHSGATDVDPDFYHDANKKKKVPRILKPKKVLLTHSSMSSVLVVRQKSWTVFFIGTGDGQLIKLAVDKAYKTACPKVRYQASDDHRVFPKMHLDPVDKQHVYVVLENQMRRVPVSQCETHRSLEECWSAQDPFCGWCAADNRCSFEDRCRGSAWLSIPGDAGQKKMIFHRIAKDENGQITLTVRVALAVGGTGVVADFSCHFSTGGGDLSALPPHFPECSCLLPHGTLPDEGLGVTVDVALGKEPLKEELRLTNCSHITGTPTSALCHGCIAAGCSWSSNVCSWTHTGAPNVCQMTDERAVNLKPEISSIQPNVTSFHGWNSALMIGTNLSHVTGVRFQGDINCNPKESHVWNNTGVRLNFHIPRGDKGSVEVCAVLEDGSCHGSASVSYRSSPSCSPVLTPSSAWASGKRKITVQGSHLEFVVGIVHSHAPQNISIPLDRSSGTLSYEAPPAKEMSVSLVSLRVANETLPCSQISYLPDPEFIAFTSRRIEDNLRITIQKKADKLSMELAELTVRGFEGTASYGCVVVPVASSNRNDTVSCEIPGTPNIQALQISFGSGVVRLESRHSSGVSLLVLLVFLLVPAIICVGVFINRSQRKQLTARMNRHLEDLELNLKSDIRQGFVDLQTEKTELIENVGAIPFLDYKHFASRIFFPESEALVATCIKDIGQDVEKVQPEECQALSRLIHDQRFLTSMVHTLEEQKSFKIKDKCEVASLLTVALHGDLAYLTQVMEDLLRDLMEQPSNAQPKLLLRRTASIVEKLLTNWMSVCLYGFLRESVGQHLFLLVSALSQLMAKGPVDSITKKALYTLNEDWLLWQAQDFTPLKLQVLFAVGSDGEVSEPLEVGVLSCDSVQQVKEKILSAFKDKFGFSYNTPLRDIHIEYEKDGSFVALQEVDAGSEVLGEVTMLNTLGHYKVPDGASVKVLSQGSHPPVSPQRSLKDDRDFSVKYFHLIDPDQRKDPERKKLRLKEVHLVKLLYTKVAVHSFVEKLFRAVWATPHGRGPQAIKYFFDFLDVQADNKKITDPDVPHIWKTNSLPLRFWVNIMKNPHFVFDVEQTPNMDGCLSVIAQAFMDSFSLSETQLGKHAPTNKLLYAKDIPKYKQEVKAYYKQIKDQPPITSSEFKDFLLEESKKHENEFNESAALRELYKYIQRYFTEIEQTLDQNGAPAELKQQMHRVKELFDGWKSCSWD